MSLAEDVAYLSQASVVGWEDFEQSRLNHVANLLRQRRALDEEIRKEQAAADVARLLIDNARLKDALDRSPVQMPLPFKEERKEANSKGKSAAA